MSKCPCSITISCISIYRPSLIVLERELSSEDSSAFIFGQTRQYCFCKNQLAKQKWTLTLALRLVNYSNRPVRSRSCCSALKFILSVVWQSRVIVSDWNEFIHLAAASTSKALKQAAADPKQMTLALCPTSGPHVNEGHDAGDSGVSEVGLWKLEPT